MTWRQTVNGMCCSHRFVWCFVNLMSGLWMQQTNKQKGTVSRIVRLPSLGTRPYIPLCLPLSRVQVAVQMRRACPVAPACHSVLPWQRAIFLHSSFSSVCPPSSSCCWPSCPPLHRQFPFLRSPLPRLGRHHPVVGVSPGLSGSTLAHIMRKKMASRSLWNCLW